MDAAIARMQSNPNDVQMQKQGLREMFSFTHDFNDDAAVGQLAQHPQVIELLTPALQNHPEDEDIPVDASFALYYILRLRPDLRTARAVPGLLAALRRWRSGNAVGALAVLCSGLPAARHEALRLGAVEELREAWEAQPGVRPSCAFCAFAIAQGDGEQLLRLAREAGWVEKLKEVQQFFTSELRRRYPTIAGELDALVQLVEEVKRTGRPPAAAGYPASADAKVATGKPVVPSVPPAAPVAKVEALLGSGRLLTAEDEEISLLPKTRWEDVPLDRSFLEELRQNPGIRAVCPRVDDIVEDVAEKYDLELQHVKSLKETLQSMGVNGAHAVLAYTYDLQEGKQEGNLYFELNKALRRRENRAVTKECWGVVVRYALQGLAALEPFQGTVYRGMPHKEFIKEHYDEGRTIEWGAFTSASTSATSAAQFMKDGVLLKIRIHSGRNVSKTSFFPVENEVLLSPKCRFTVTQEAYYDKDLGVEVLEMMEQKGDVFKS